MRTTLIDLAGQRFGRLTVIGREGTVYGQASWLCSCSCGKQTVVRGHSLRNGDTHSCGCLAAEQASARLKKHGKTHAKLFSVWSGMLARCYKTWHKSFEAYGGRGVAVCEEWQQDFMSFYTWAHENGYRDTLTLDRINNDGNYEPSNCRWATPREQGNNRRTNTFVTINGESKTIANWAREYAIMPDTIYGRIRRGWDAEAAVLTPVRRISCN